jgi:hypothetical protein
MVIPTDPPEVTKVHKHHIIGTVYIRGLAFKCTAGSRRQQVLLSLKKKDEKDADWLWLLGVSVFVAGFFSGILAAWYL